MGTPVDPVPDVIRSALVAAANAPGYPLTAGTTVLRGAISDWVTRVCGAQPGFGVLPTIGTKELVAWLPTLLGLGPADVVVIPEICYPTYEVGALLAGAQVVRCDHQAQLDDPDRVGLIWLNSPGNPTGRVMSAAQLREVVDWASPRGVVVASDECYLPLGWDATPVSVLSVCSGEYDRLLAVHSLSKRSNLAGYRGGFLAGDPSLVRELLGVRKHAGMMVPFPVQAAMVAALGDEDHVAEQRERYAIRRSLLRDAVKSAGFTIEHSEAGLYLWATRHEPCWDTVDWFARRGVLVAPGAFYGPSGDRHVRIALTATDERVQSAAARLTN
jgi:succinyldiaminopimelate transaminase